MGAGGGGGNKGAMAEINVTPFVDVMLVLLVIFMITAPLMLNGVRIDLPRTRETNPIDLSASQVILSLTLSGNLYVGERRVSREEAVREIRERFDKDGTDTVFLRADFALQYGAVASLMSFLKGSGVDKVALVTEFER